MKAIKMSVKFQYSTRTSAGHLAMFITVLIREPSGPHEEPSATAVDKHVAYRLN